MAKTMTDIRNRCRMVDGHWLWAGAVSSGWPRVSAPDYTHHEGQHKSQHGRRAVWHIMNGKPIPSGWRVFGTCEYRECLNPAHMVCEPTSEWGKRLSESGKLCGDIRRITAVRSAGRKRSKLTHEQITLVLTSPKTGLELASELGVSNRTISKVRTGNARAFQPVGGLFTGLMSLSD